MNTQLVTAIVMHHRLRPAKHRFVYPIFMLRVDIQELCAENSVLNNAVFGVNRLRPLSMYFKDYGPRDGSSLYTWIQALLLSQQVPNVARVELLSFPRIFGYAFNPISLWYCYNPDDQLTAVLAEVNNTFGEHHFYLLRDQANSPITKESVLVSEKMMHVSPFCEIKGEYQFKFLEVGKKMKVAIDYHDEQGLLLQTAIIGQQQNFNRGTLMKALLRQPFLTFGVFIKIHWHAALLWRKRVPFYRQSKIINRQISFGEPVKQEQSK